MEKIFLVILSITINKTPSLNLLIRNECLFDTFSFKAPGNREKAPW